MNKFKVGMAFSKDFIGNSPLSHIGVKLPVYIRLLDLCIKKGWEAYVLTKKTYQGGGVFEGVWKFTDGKFKKINSPVKMELVYDRSAGVKFPPENDNSCIWVNKKSFKMLCWNKWLAYKAIGKHMPRTFWLENEKDVDKILPNIRTQYIVIKPYNGLKGMGVFIGPKLLAKGFKFGSKFKHYIAQEFVDTSNGISKITSGLHDLRVAIVNNKVVWSHIRVPEKGSFLANAAMGGNLTEIDYESVPNSVRSIVKDISKKFYEKYDDPSYSIDFGIDKNGKPKIFEINDQIGFPRWEMINRDEFLNSLIYNFNRKLHERIS